MPELEKTKYLAKHYFQNQKAMLNVHLEIEILITEVETIAEMIADPDAINSLSY
jgi:hypothetical protein